MAAQQDPAAVTHALVQIFNCQIDGKPDHASAWAAELCRLLGCEDIINTRGRELRRDFHAGPRNAMGWLCE
jgi:hypothetical protein